MSLSRGAFFASDNPWVLLPRTSKFDMRGIVEVSGIPRLPAAVPGKIAPKLASKSAPCAARPARPLGGGQVDADQIISGSERRFISSLTGSITCSKLSTDPLFVGKVRDIVGLYLSPPEGAIVLYVDEKARFRRSTAHARPPMQPPNRSAELRSPTTS